MESTFKSVESDRFRAGARMGKGLPGDQQLGQSNHCDQASLR